MMVIDLQSTVVGALGRAQLACGLPAHAGSDMSYAS
jgi:hypothetical protein